MEKNWYKLDKAAKVFPSTSSKDDPRTFRIVAELKENIDQNILQVSVEKALLEYPIFTSVLKRGFFWYYLETSDLMPVIEIEKTAPCTKMYDQHSRNLLFRVTYFNKRINLEVYHALSDGAGSIEFLKTIVINYLIAKYELSNDIENVSNASLLEKEMDSFEKYYEPYLPKFISKSQRAYKINYPKLKNNNIKVIEGVISTKALLKLAKENNATISVFLSAILFLAIEETMHSKDKKKSINFLVPINFRNYFKSNTVRNFFGIMNVSYSFNKKNHHLKDVIKSVKSQFKKNLKEDIINKSLNDFTFVEHNLLIRVIPLAIKDLLLKIAGVFSGFNITLTFSNVGIIKMPPELKEYIELFSVFTSTKAIQLCICSFEDNLVVGFSSRFVNAEVEKNFFRILSKMGLKVIINSNYYDAGGLK